jgi:dephospho-CoA kinase
MRIGITGGIGSGKSEVTRYLRSLGEYVICADEVSRQIVKPGEEGSIALRHVFGDEIFLADGSLDRKKLAAEVFTDEERLQALNHTLHPLILARIDKQAKLQKGRIFIDAALLIQTGMHKTVDYIWLVVADRQTRVERVMKRDGLTAQEVERRIESQLSDDEMKPFADEIIDNSGSIDAMHRRVDELLKQPKM